MTITHRSDIAWYAFDVKAHEYLTLQLTVNKRGVVYLHGVNGCDVGSIDGVPLPNDDFANWVRAAGSDALDCKCGGTVDTDCICVPSWEEQEAKAV